MTLSLTTLSLMTLSTTTCSINVTQHKKKCLYAKCRFAQCHVLFIIMLIVIMLHVIMLSVVAPFITLQEEELYNIILTFIAILKEMFIREITIWNGRVYKCFPRTIWYNWKGLQKVFVSQNCLLLIFVFNGGIVLHRLNLIKLYGCVMDALT